MAQRAAEQHGVASEQRSSPVAEQNHSEQQTAPVVVVVERPAEPVAQVVAAVPAPEIAPAPVFVPAPVIVPAPAPVQASLPMIDSSPLATSNLVQIETAPSKLAAVATVQQNETAQQPTTRRRSRPREVYSMASSEPLVQIETQNKPD
jgi:ribonuclease E